MEWISVDDRLPQVDGEHLCRLMAYDEDQIFHEVGAWFGAGDEFNFAVDSICDRHVVTHWMPLPAPPKDKP